MYIAHALFRLLTNQIVRSSHSLQVAMVDIRIKSKLTSFGHLLEAYRSHLYMLSKPAPYSHISDKLTTLETIIQQLRNDRGNDRPSERPPPNACWPSDDWELLTVTALNTTKVDVITGMKALLQDMQRTITSQNRKIEGQAHETTKLRGPELSSCGKRSLVSYHTPTWRVYHDNWSEYTNYITPHYRGTLEDHLHDEGSHLRVGATATRLVGQHTHWKFFCGRSQRWLEENGMHLIVELRPYTPLHFTLIEMMATLIFRYFLWSWPLSLIRTPPSHCPNIAR